MLKFFRKIRMITRNYDSEMARIERKVDQATSFIRERTEVHVDVHMKSPSQVIMIGRYRGKDFVNIYDVGQGEFEHLLEHLKQVNRYAKPCRVDSPWPMVNAVIDRELNGIL